MQNHSSNYWENRYRHKDTPWDLDEPHPAITQYFKHVDDKTQKILIPGAGNGHEGEWLWRHGFQDVYLCDWAESALQNFSRRIPDFPKEQLYEINFFNLEDHYDIILEHTFFCALPPSLRRNYAAHTARLLQERKGALVGVLFVEELGADEPPYGGTEQEYKELFEQYYDQVECTTIPETLAPRSIEEVLFESKIC